MLYYTYTENYTTLREPCSDDSWDRGDDDAGWDFGGLYYCENQEEVYKLGPMHRTVGGDYTNPNPACKDMKEGTGYAVVVKYGDGDTFGHTSGMGMVWDVFPTEKEALTCVDALQHNEIGPHYKPWNGYFASLEDISVVKSDIRRKHP